MRRTLGRRNVLALLGTAGLSGCSLLEPGEEATPTFVDGPAEWVGDPPEIPDDAWPMQKRTPAGTASTPAAGPTDFRLEQAWEIAGVGDDTYPVSRDGTVVFYDSDTSNTGNRGQYVAVDATDGAEIWRTTRDARATPALTSETLFAPTQYSDQPGLTAYDAADGTERWHYDLEYINSGVVLTGSAVLTTAGRGCKVVALDQASGELIWRYELGRSGCGVGGLAVADMIYFVTTSQRTAVNDPAVATVHALDPVAGERVWSSEHEGTANDIAVTDGKVVVASSQTVVALDADSGTVEWRHDLENTADRSIAIRDGCVVATAEDSLVAYELADGSQRWRMIDAQESAIGDTVVYGVGSRFAAYDISSGEVLSTDDSSAMAAEAPTVADGRLYTTTSDHRLIAWE